MGYGSNWYNVALLVHIVCAIVGFGGVILNGLYGKQAQRRPGPEGLAITEANYSVSTVAEVFIWVVGLSGIALVLLSDGVWEFSQAWVTVALSLYLLGIVLAQGVLFPTARRMKKLMAELVAMGPPPAGAPAAGAPPQAAELEQLGKRLGVVSPVLHLLLVAIIVLMIWKPWL